MRVNDIKNPAIDYDKTAITVGEGQKNKTESQSVKVGDAYKVDELAITSKNPSAKEAEREFYINFFNTTISSISSGGNFIEALNNEYDKLKESINENYDDGSAKDAALKGLDNAYKEQAKYAAGYFSTMVTFGFDYDYGIGLNQNPVDFINNYSNYQDSQMKDTKYSLQKDILELLEDSLAGLDNEALRSAIYGLSIDDIGKMSETAKENAENGVNMNNIVSKLEQKTVE